MKKVFIFTQSFNAMNKLIHAAFLYLLLFGACNSSKRIPYQSSICIPIYVAGKDEMIKQLNDTTWLYRINGKLVKGPSNQCRCLPEDARIATLSGERPISSLKPGERIMVRINEADISEVAIKKINKIPVSQPYKMIELTMEDGKKIRASGLHPVEHGKPLSSYKKGDMVIGYRIISVNEVVYEGTHTWDLLTEGPPSRYRVNGLWMESTMQIEADSTNQQ